MKSTRRQKFILLAMLVLAAILPTTCTCDNDEDSSDDADDVDDDDADDDINDDSGNDDADDDSGIFDPPVLPFSYLREDDSAPITPEELVEFSERLKEFYSENSYIDWLLRMSHGVDDSTEMKDYRLFWRDVIAEKQGETVSIIHKYYDAHGGHNILKDNSLVVESVISGYLKTEDPVLEELARLFCGGISSNMLGMVYDTDDTVLHLMARNVVPFNHSYTTHDGRNKSVDYSNWHHPYDRWNCSRFKYENNPYWGEVWVTNTRSKDGVGYLLNASRYVSYAAQYAKAPEVREACGEAHELLTLFAKDIVDSQYLIRSKDKDGNPYRPGIDPEPDEADVGDLASLAAWDIIAPDAECNAKQATAFLGYGERLQNNCTPLGGHRIYELGAIVNNPPNGHIMRSFHIANIALALHNGDYDAAYKSLGGLELRFDRDLNIDLSHVNTSEDSWYRDIALNWLQAASAGYFLTGDEIRAIHTYTLRSIDEYSQWDNWDLWADSILEDQELEAFPPTGKTLDDETKISWFRPNALGLFMEYCWGAYQNPHSQKIIDCEVFGF
jgi:hypothetical protein